jgi:dipeptidyl-peptidase-3
MRNRQLIAQWVYQQGKQDNVVELKQRDGKIFVVVNDYQKLRQLFGQLLKEVQRIKSTGDFNAGKQLVENYGVKVDPTIHAEILQRYKKLDLAPYKGFVNPVFVTEKDQNGQIINVTLDYSENYTDQMIRYSHNYRTLDNFN